MMMLDWLLGNNQEDARIKALEDEEAEYFVYYVRQREQWIVSQYGKGDMNERLKLLGE